MKNIIRELFKISKLIDESQCIKEAVNNDEDIEDVNWEKVNRNLKSLKSSVKDLETTVGHKEIDPIFDNIDSILASLGGVFYGYGYPNIQEIFSGVRFELGKRKTELRHRW